MNASPCPVCKKSVLPRSSNPSAPFCSPRCRAVDLGRWLGEEYRVAARHAEDEEDALPSDHPSAGRNERDGH